MMYSDLILIFSLSYTSIQVNWDKINPSPAGPGYTLSLQTV